MPKIHELLAVESNLKGQAQKNRIELQGTMEKKRHLFQSKVVTYKPLESGLPDETREQSDIQSTITKEVAWLTGFIVKAIDASYALDVANTQAKADIVLEDEQVIAKGVPCTALLQLEKRMKEVHEFVLAIPTLDPAKGFREDTSREKGIYIARDVTKSSTKKIEEYPIIVPATKEFPAQVAKVTTDVKVGTIFEQEWSALITPATKAELLDRAEIMIRAVTKARSRANDTEIDVKTNKIGKVLLEYVFKPLS